MFGNKKATWQDKLEMWRLNVINGMTKKDIATRKGIDRTYVSKCVKEVNMTLCASGNS